MTYRHDGQHSKANERGEDHQAAQLQVDPDVNLFVQVESWLHGSLGSRRSRGEPRCWRFSRFSSWERKTRHFGQPVPLTVLFLGSRQKQNERKKTVWVRP